jgi:hypothetical protein
VKDTKLIILIFGGVSLVGLMVMLCGIGLSFGSRKLSLFGFISAITLLIILRIIGWARCSEGRRRQ